jgi:hypothetical protein
MFIYITANITSPASLTCRSRMRESSSGPRIAGMRTVRPALQPRRYVYKHELSEAGEVISDQKKPPRTFILVSPSILKLCNASLATVAVASSAIAQL